MRERILVVDDNEVVLSQIGKLVMKVSLAPRIALGIDSIHIRLGLRAALTVPTHDTFDALISWGDNTHTEAFFGRQREACATADEHASLLGSRYAQDVAQAVAILSSDIFSDQPSQCVLVPLPCFLVDALQALLGSMAPFCDSPQELFAQVDRVELFRQVSANGAAAGAGLAGEGNVGQRLPLLGRKSPTLASLRRSSSRIRSHVLR